MRVSLNTNIAALCLVLSGCPPVCGEDLRDTLTEAPLMALESGRKRYVARHGRDPGALTDLYSADVCNENPCFARIPKDGWGLEFFEKRDAGRLVAICSSGKDRTRLTEDDMCIQSGGHL